jgi:carboxypeptidase C (cathepsin A)
MRFFILAFLLLFLWAHAVEYGQEALSDEVTELPGLNDEVTFRQFSGYIPVSDSGKNIHYWFVEAEENPETAPVVFWTNGGPGCSGLLGFMTEMGPFRPQADLSLELNEWRWNKLANMVYVEQPAGVGFSYSDDKDDYKTGDKQAAEDAYNLVKGWLNRFSSYKSNKLYWSSESYGGHYMPTFAAEIVSQNSTDINFQGFLVGNPYNDFYSGSGAMIDTYWGHQLVDGITWNKYQTLCSDAKTKLSEPQCELLEAKLSQEIGNLNPYALDYPVCLESGSLAKHGRAQRLWLLETVLPEHMKEHLLPLSSSDYEPCGDNYATAYLNQESVKEAIHVNADIDWEECSYKLRYNYVWEMVPMTPIYDSLLNNQDLELDILVYSGDDDAVCATIGTQEWIYGVKNVEVDSLWKVWTSGDGQVGGYHTTFTTPTNSRFAFTTVHGAGHEVPTYKPQQAFEVFESYLNGNVFEEQD